MAAVGDTNVTNKLLKGYDVGGKTYKVHLDGYNQLPYLTGQQDHSARKEFIYFNDDGDLVALRIENWKIVFEEQRTPGTLALWIDPFTKLRTPKVFDLRSDPYERADITSNSYYEWLLGGNVAGAFFSSQPVVAKFLTTFKEYPPSQRPSSFSIDQIVEKMERGFNSGD
jgi:arylsulfatase